MNEYVILYITKLIPTITTADSLVWNMRYTHFIMGCGVSLMDWMQNFNFTF